MGSIRNVDCGSLKHWRAALPAGLQNQIHESPGLGSPQIKNYALFKILRAHTFFAFSNRRSSTKGEPYNYQTQIIFFMGIDARKRRKKG
jgi:hypothetical protein